MVNDGDQIIGIVTVDDVIDAMTQEMTEDTLKFGGMEALNKPYMQIGFVQMLRKRAGWLGVLFLSEMLTASAMQHFEGRTGESSRFDPFYPAYHEFRRQFRFSSHVFADPRPGVAGIAVEGLVAGCVARNSDWPRARLVPRADRRGSDCAWQMMGLYDYGQHWPLVAATVGTALIGIVTFGSLAGSMLPFAMQKTRLRSRERLGAVRGNARRCYRIGDLLQYCLDNPVGNIALKLLACMAAMQAKTLCPLSHLRKNMYGARKCKAAQLRWRPQSSKREPYETAQHRDHRTR